MHRCPFKKLACIQIQAHKQAVPRSAASFADTEPQITSLSPRSAPTSIF